MTPETCAAAAKYRLIIVEIRKCVVQRHRPLEKVRLLRDDIERALCPADWISRTRRVGRDGPTSRASERTERSGHG
jgi:hypothetical protein